MKLKLEGHQIIIKWLFCEIKEYTFKIYQIECDNDKKPQFELNESSVYFQLKVQITFKFFIFNKLLVFIRLWWCWWWRWWGGGGWGWWWCE